MTGIKTTVVRTNPSSNRPISKSQRTVSYKEIAAALSDPSAFKKLTKSPYLIDVQKLPTYIFKHKDREVAVRQAFQFLRETGLRLNKDVMLWISGDEIHIHGLYPHPDLSEKALDAIARDLSFIYPAMKSPKTGDRALVDGFFSPRPDGSMKVPVDVSLIPSDKKEPDFNLLKVVAEEKWSYVKALGRVPENWLPKETEEAKKLSEYAAAYYRKKELVDIGKNLWILRKPGEGEKSHQSGGQNGNGSTKRDDQSPSVDLETARQMLSLKLSTFLFSEEKGKTLVLEVTPGVGKTYAAAKVAVDLAKEGKTVFFALSSRRNQLEMLKTLKEMGLSEKDENELNEDKTPCCGLILGRCEENCRHFELVETLCTAGYNVRETLCKKCLAEAGETFSNTTCPYLSQFVDPPDVAVGTYETIMLLSDFVKQNYDIIVMDEEVYRIVTSTKQITDSLIQKVERFMTPAILGPNRIYLEMISVLRETLTYVTNELSTEKPVRYTRVYLYEVIQEVVKNHKGEVNLKNLQRVILECSDYLKERIDRVITEYTLSELKRQIELLPPRWFPDFLKALAKEFDIPELRKPYPYLGKMRERYLVLLCWVTSLYHPKERSEEEPPKKKPSKKKPQKKKR